MAREMALAGVDPSELLPPPPPEQPHTFREKWDNFWYHYKITFWVVAAIVAIAVTILVQTVTKNPADYEVVVVTEYALLPPETDGMKAYLASVGQDVDGDGEVEILIDNIVPNFQSDGSYSIGFADQQKLINYIAAGEKMIYVFDRLSYEGFLANISQVTDSDYSFYAALDITDAGYDPDGCYWSWKGDPRLAQYNLTEQAEDMLFGVRSPEGTAGGEKSQAMYEQGKQLIEALAEQKEGN